MLEYKKFQVVGLARRMDKLQNVAKALLGKKGTFHPIQADVTIEKDVLKAFEWIKRNLGCVSVVINNAGLLKPLYLPTFDTEDAKAAFDLNAVALAVVSREAIKMMKEEGHNGHIINMNSISGRKVYNIPGMAFYFATKHAVTALTQSLNHELRREKMNTKVTVGNINKKCGLPIEP